MNTTSRTITGIATVLFGLFLTILGLINDIWILIYAIPIIIIGIFIFFNKKEDEIEKVKSRKNKGQ